MKPIVNFASVIIAMLTTAQAATQYWDTDGNAGNNDGGTGAGLGGTGTWSATDPNATNWWDGVSTTTLGLWTENNDAIFWGTAGTVTLDAGHTANSLTFKTDGYTITNSTLTGVASLTNDVQTGTAILATTLIGSSGYTKIGSGTLLVNNTANTISGPIGVYGGTLEIPSSAAIGATGILNAGDVTLDGGTVRNDTAGLGVSLISSNRSIIAGPNSGTIYLPTAGAIVIHEAYITGTGNTLTLLGPGELRVRTNTLFSGHNTFSKLIIDGAEWTIGQSNVPAPEDCTGAVPSVTTDDAITLQNGGTLSGNSVDTALNSKRGITLGVNGGNLNCVSGFTLTIPSAIKGPGKALKFGVDFVNASGRAGTVALSNTANVFGDITISNGTVRLDANPVIPVSSSVIIPRGTLLLNGVDQTIATLSLIGGSVAGSANTLTASTYDLQSGTVSAKLGGTAGPAKTTSGTVTLSGANTYIGTTAVNVGKLVTTTASTGAGSYSVADSATLGVAVATAGTSLAMSSLTVGISTGCTLEFDLAGLGAPSAPIVTNAGTLTVNGTIAVNAKGFSNNVTATLLQYAPGSRSGGGSFTLGLLPPHFTGTITDDTINGKVILTVTSTPSLQFVGDTADNWTTNKSSHLIWKILGTATTTYYQENGLQGDMVQFDDTATATTPVNLTNTVQPYNVTISNVTKAYNFIGTGKISGATGITKDGTGTATISTVNDFTGPVVIKAGVLVVTNGTALGSTAGSTIVSNGAALSTSSTAAFAEPLVLNGTGILNAGALRHTANNQTASGAITLGSSGVRINCDLNTLTLSGGISGAGNPTLNMGGSGSVTVNTQPINIGTGTLNKDGSGTLTLSLVNTIGSVTIANGGQITLGNNNSLGTGSVDILSTGGNIATSSAMTNATAITNSFILDGKLQLAGSNPAELSSPITMNGNQEIDVNTAGNVLILSGGIGGIGNFTKGNGGIMTISAACSYSGTTKFNNGTMNLIGGDNRLPVGTFLTLGNSGNSVRVVLGDASAKSDQTLTGLAISGTGIATAIVGGNPAVSTLTVNTTTANTYSQSLGGANANDNNLALVKTGAGSLNLSLAAGNTYTGGTTVSGGALFVNNTSGSGTGSGNVSVGANATLGGSGSIQGAVTVTGGTVAPGNSAGKLTFQNGLDLSSGAKYAWELGAFADDAGGVAGTDFDQIALTGGNVALGGSSKISIGFTGSASSPDGGNPFWSANHTWTVISLAGGSNTGDTDFPSTANAVYNSGYFTTSVNAGNVLLNFTAVSAQPSITSVTGAGTTNVAVNFNTLVKGATYQVQYKDVLDSGPWSVLGSVLVTTPGPVSIQDHTSPAPSQRFYRIVVQ